MFNHTTPKVCAPSLLSLCLALHSVSAPFLRHQPSIVPLLLDFPLFVPPHPSPSPLILPLFSLHFDPSPSHSSPPPPPTHPQSYPYSHFTLTPPLPTHLPLPLPLTLNLTPILTSLRPHPSHSPAHSYRSISVLSISFSDCTRQCPTVHG